MRFFRASGRKLRRFVQMNASGRISLFLRGHKFRPGFTTRKPLGLGLFAHFKLVHDGQYLGRFRCRLKYGLGVASGESLIPFADVGRGIAFGHGQIEPGPGQHGEHFGPHFFKSVVLEVMSLLFLTIFPLGVACGMICLMQFGGVVFFSTDEAFRKRHFHHIGLRFVVGITRVMFHRDARAGDKAFNKVIALHSGHGVGLAFLGRKTFDLRSVEHRERIEQRHTLHVWNFQSLVFLGSKFLDLLVGEIFPFAVFLDDEGNFFRAKKFGALGPLFDLHVASRMVGLNLLELFERHPPVVLVAVDDAGEHELDHVGPAVFAPRCGAKGHPQRGISRPGFLPLARCFGQDKHVFRHTVDELFLHFAADLEAVFLFRRLFLAHIASCTSTITVSGSSCGLRKPAAMASSRLMTKAPASNCRSMSAGVRGTRSFSGRRTGASKRP